MLVRTERRMNALIIQVSIFFSRHRLESHNLYLLGYLKVDYAMFVDWDEDCHGPEDTPENREAYPENFKWTCCRKDGRRHGCHRSEHVAQRKKRRV